MTATELVLLAAAYSGGSGVLSFAIGRLSPGIPGPLRDVLASGGPMAVVFASLLGGAQSVTLDGGDLLTGAALAVSGLASSVFVRRKVDRKAIAPRRV